MSKIKTTVHQLWAVLLVVHNNALILLDTTNRSDTNNNQTIIVVATTTIKVKVVLLVKLTKTTAATRTNIWVARETFKHHNQCPQLCQDLCQCQVLCPCLCPAVCQCQLLVWSLLRLVTCKCKFNLLNPLTPCQMSFTTRPCQSTPLSLRSTPPTNRPSVLSSLNSSRNLLVSNMHPKSLVCLSTCPSLKSRDT